MPGLVEAKPNGSNATGGSLAAGDTRLVPLGATVALGNRGGLISLLNPDGLKVDGIAYTKDQANREGWTLAF